ncbi:hypothetical protein Taro_008630, partial [Colocasia esculenta]|nr:hypothetical protein [Colocasia esculenta]
LWLLGSDRRSRRELRGVRTNQGILIKSDLGSADLSKAIGRYLTYGLTKYVSYNSGLYVPGVYSLAQAGLSIARPSLANPTIRELTVLHLGSSKARV